MTEQLVHIKLDRDAKFTSMWINHPLTGTMAHSADFDFNSRVKDNILALFSVGGRAGVMSVLCSACDDEIDAQVVKAFVEAYGTTVNEPVSVLDYAVLLDYDLHLPHGDISLDTKYATVYRWEAGPEGGKHPFLEIYRTQDERRRAVGVGVFEGLELDATLLDFLATVKLIYRPEELSDAEDAR